MARAKEHDGPLRECPVCETPLAETVNLGLRDFSWVNEELGQKLGLMDLDGVLSQFSTGRMLVLEMKPGGKPVSTGARLTFAALVRAGYDVWVVWDLGDGKVRVGECNDQGRTPTRKILTRKKLASAVRKWWESGI